MSYPRVQIKRRPVKTSTVVNGLLHGEMGYIDDVNELYIGAYDDATMPAKLLNVKNTAGALNKSGLLYLVGAPVQSNNPTTFSNFQVFIDENDKLNAPNYVATDNHDKINFDGNAATAEKWRTPVSLSVTGLATGSVTFDGATKSLTLNLGESSGLTGAYLKDVIEDKKNSAGTSGLMPSTDANTVDNRFILVLGNGSYKSAIKIIRSISSLWTNGNAAGPVLSITLNGVVHKIAAIPSATASISGVVTTGAQTFGGTKTFANDVNVSGNESVSGTLNVTGDINGGKTLTVASTANINGILYAKNSTDSTATNNGSVVVTGGVGIAKQLRVGTNATISGTTFMGNSLTIQYVTPNLHICNTNGNQNSYAILRFRNTNATGDAIIFLNDAKRTDDGGANLMTIRNNVGDLRLDDNVRVTGTLNVTLATGLSNTLTVSGATTLSSTLRVAGITILANTTDSTATTNGGTIISGGLGVAKQIRAGGNVTAPTFIGALSGNATSASYWQTARTLTLGSDLSGSVSIKGDANVTLNGNVNLISTTYTGNGGAQPPSYIPNGKARFAMMNSWKGLSGFGGYCDVILMDNYTGSDVPWTTSIGILKSSTLRAWIATGAKNNTTTWNSMAELLHSSNYTNWTVTKTGGGASGTWPISITGNAATATKLTSSAGNNQLPVYFNDGKPVQITPAQMFSVFSLTNGTTAGPVISATIATQNKTITLPTASASISGVVTTGVQTFGGAKTFNSTLTVVDNITANSRILLNRGGGNGKGYISFWAPNYITWIDYMNDVSASPVTTKSATIGTITTWARRSLIENLGSYGWIWESSANTANSAVTAQMGLNANTGNLYVRGTVQAPTFLGSLSGNVTRLQFTTSSNNWGDSKPSYSSTNGRVYFMLVE